MILICSAIFWLGLFGLFLGGFEFIGLYDDLFNGIFEYLFSMFFLSILVMLFFSTGIIIYTGLFQSREAAFLLTTPASTDRIFAYKFVEAVGLSSWGFFLLGSPLMVAYGLTVKAPLGVLRMFLAYLLSFVLIAGSLGAVAAIVVANVFPKRQKLVFSVAIIGDPRADGAVLGFRVWRAPGEALSRATGSVACKTGWLSARIRSGRADGCRPACWPPPGATNGVRPAIT